MRPAPPGLVPFRIEVPSRVLEDLAERLARVRLPGAPVDAGWDYGIEPGYLLRLVDYWRAFVGVPTAFVACRTMSSRRPRPMCAAHPQLCEADRAHGGRHFLACARPAEFVEDVRAFFRDYRDGRSG